MGWSVVKNGKLLALAADAFDAVGTVDKNLPHQQNLSALPVAVVLLDAVAHPDDAPGQLGGACRRKRHRQRLLREVKHGDGSVLGR
jgi:hypothetical protein